MVTSAVSCIRTLEPGQELILEEGGRVLRLQVVAVNGSVRLRLAGFEGMTVAIGNMVPRTRPFQRRARLEAT